MIKRILVMIAVLLLFTGCGKGGATDTEDMTEMLPLENTETVVEELTEATEETGTTEISGGAEIVETPVSTEQVNESKPPVSTEMTEVSETPESSEPPTVPEPSEETEVVEETESWVKDLEIAQSTSQIVAVVEQGGDATVSFHAKDENGEWAEIFSVEGRIGKNGIGKTKEGDKKTPTGVYRFNMAFGILSDPGISALPYLQVDESHHWVDDSNSKYYNQFVSTRDVEVDWTSSEHLYTVTYSYKYVLSLNYNEACVPGAGSAIFLHCPSNGFKKTSGCIAIPVENMKRLMQMLEKDCVIVIDSRDNIMNY